MRSSLGEAALSIATLLSVCPSVRLSRAEGAENDGHENLGHDIAGYKSARYQTSSEAANVWGWIDWVDLALLLCSLLRHDASTSVEDDADDRSSVHYRGSGCYNALSCIKATVSCFRAFAIFIDLYILCIHFCVASTKNNGMFIYNKLSLMHSALQCCVFKK